MLKTTVSIITTLLISTALFAQSYTIAPQESKVTVTGTSTIHDWESTAEEFSGSATINMEEGKLVSIEGLTFNVLVEGIKSGKGGMDKKTYDALNEKKHPNIVFKLNEIAEINADSLIANGSLTISGKTNEIQMTVGYELLEDGTITFKGSKALKMTDYNVDPPTAMLGTIKAGNEVEVHFDAKFVQ